MVTQIRIIPSNSTFTFVRNVWKSFRAESGLEGILFTGLVHRDEKPPHRVLNITKSEVGKVEFSLNIQGRHTNRLKILHGGAIASLVDLGGSLAVASQGLFSTGVSTDLNISYLRSGGQVGDKIKVEATCDKMGWTMAFTTVKIFNEDGELVARGSHTKYIKDANRSQAALGGRFLYPDSFKDSFKPELEINRAFKEAKKKAQAAPTDSMQAASEEDQAKVEESTEEMKAAEQPTEEDKTKE